MKVWIGWEDDDTAEPIDQSIEGCLKSPQSKKWEKADPCLSRSHNKLILSWREDDGLWYMQPMKNGSLCRNLKETQAQSGNWQLGNQFLKH